MAVAKGDQVVPPIELECPVVGCELGEAGGKYKTPPLPSEERFGDSISHCVEVSASVTTMENIGDKK